MIFLSKILNVKILDNSGQSVGTLTDLLVEPGQDYLPVTRLVVRNGRRRTMLDVASLQGSPTGVSLSVERDQLQFQEVPEDEIHLARDILDAQVIDVHGAKVIRVNDVGLDQVEGRWIVSGLDIGAWGMCRRLGIAHWLRKVSEWFRFTVPEGIVPWSKVAPLSAGFRVLQLQVSSRDLERMHPADLADVVEELGHRERQQLLATMTVEQTADLVEESDPSMQLAILRDLDDERAADVLEAMEPDDAADLLADVPEDERDRLMERMEPEEAEEVRRLMQWDEGTAGALMNTSYWSVSAAMTRGEALEHFRSGGAACEEVLHVYALDREQRLQGVLNLRRIVLAPDGQPLSEILDDDPDWVGPQEPVERVHRQMMRYGLLAMPVLDEERRLLGVVTVYDLLEQLAAD